MTAPSTYRGAKPCGTPAAAGRHRYYGEALCHECRQAEAERNRQQRRGLRPKRKQPRHGTISGYRHLHPDGNRCRACLEAMAEYNRKWRAGKLRSDERKPTKTPDLIVDVLETFYPMPSEVLIDRVLDLKPAWSYARVRKAIERMVSDGRLQRVERLGEWVMRLND